MMKQGRKYWREQEQLPMKLEESPKSIPKVFEKIQKRLSQVTEASQSELDYNAKVAKALEDAVWAWKMRLGDRHSLLKFPEGESYSVFEKEFAGVIFEFSKACKCSFSDALSVVLDYIRNTRKWAHLSGICRSEDFAEYCPDADILPWCNSDSPTLLRKKAYLLRTVRVGYPELIPVEALRMLDRVAPDSLVKQL